MKSRTILTALALIPVAILLFSGLSFVHPIADSFAVFRVPLGFLSILSGAVLWIMRGRRSGMLVIALGVAAAVPVVLSPYLDTQAPETGYRLYQKNMATNLPSTKPVSDDIIARNPDFVTLQEVVEDNRDIVKNLLTTLPSSLYCRYATVGGTVVMSKFPAIAGQKICNRRAGLAAMQVQTPQGPLWVVALHLHWPYPFRQASQVQSLLPVLRDLKGKVVIGGDFNMVPWSRTVELIEAASGTARVGYVNPTYDLGGWFPMPIDHVLAPMGQSGQVVSLPLLGSDHRGVLATFTLK